MSIRGDLAYALIAVYAMELNRANDMVRIMLDAADDPNIAQKFAEIQDAENDAEINTFMCQYWDVISFLKRHVL